MPPIVISERILGTAVDRLDQSFGALRDDDLWRRPEDLTRALAQAKAILVRNQTQVTADLIAAAPNLLVIARAGVGLDNIDTTAATAAGIVVTYAPRENSVTAAELALGLILSLARQIPAADRDTRAGGWKRQVYTGAEIAHKTLGIVGFGRIGQLVAKRARPFEMNLLAYDPVIPQNSPVYRDIGVSPVSLDDLLAKADFITLHVPLTPDTKHLLNAERFARMKPGARLVNTARGEVIDETALLAALDAGRLAACALDVRDPEPPITGELEKRDNVILTPHIAGFTHEAQERVVTAVCADVEAVLEGRPTINHFNFPVPRKGH